MSILGIGLSLLGGGGVIGAIIALVPGAAEIAGKAVGGTITFLSGIPWGKIWWVFPIAAALAFGLYKDFKYRAIEKEIPALKQRAADSHAAFLAEKKSFAIEKAGLDRANGLIDDNNRRIAAASTELARETARAAVDEARNAKLARSTDARIAGVRASVNAHPPCVLPDAAKKALDDL